MSPLLMDLPVRVIMLQPRLIASKSIDYFLGGRVDPGFTF
jgi:hypothetical protein